MIRRVRREHRLNKICFDGGCPPAKHQLMMVAHFATTEHVVRSEYLVYDIASLLKDVFGFFGLLLGYRLKIN